MTAKVLVVDDEADLEILVCQKFRREIRKKELIFEFAQNGVVALEKVNQIPDIDVVMTDINMPEMDGLTLLEKLRQVNPNFKSIVISAYGDLENIRSAMNRGAHDFLTKPIDFEDLKITLKKTLAYVAELKAFEKAQREKRVAEKQALEKERLAKETQRKLVEQLRKQDRLKDEFLASTSHELRTPLNGIIGIVDSLIDGATGPLQQETLRNLEMVSACGRRLSSLVDDILDFSKMKSGELRLNRQAVFPANAIDSVLSLSKPLIQQKSLELINEVPQNFPAVDVDPNRFLQILHNLVGNGIKFSKTGSVSVRAVDLGENVRFEVVDTGIGIPEDKLEDIFKMFEQVESSLTRSQGGTGLGLAITKRLVEAHEGTIEVTSQVNHGSTFSFVLPKASSELISQTNAAPSSEIENAKNSSLPEIPDDPFIGFVPQILNKGEYRVLVVDDEPVNQQVLANHLSLQSYTIVPAMNGAEALRTLQDDEEGFDLVILDVMMPGMSGYEVCRTMRESFSLLELPVLMLTAKNQTKDFIHGLEAGANDYITKPFDKRELLARVRTLLTLKEAVQSATAKARELLAIEQKSRGLEQQVNAANRSEEEARAAERHKEDFLAMMAHELRTPLNAIIGYSEILHEDLEIDEQHQFIPDVNKVQTSAKHLLALINNILDLSKIERGKMELYIEDCEMVPFIDKIITTIEPLANRNGNLLEVSYSDDLSHFRSDMTKVSQILINLLSNACKFTRQGSVKLSVQQFEKDEDVHLRFSVKDTGIGMTREQVAKLFMPFHQASSRIQRDFGGTGLGLVICKRFCDLMNGNIEVSSEIGEGTTFSLEIPRYASP
jgi:two-component system sensor histidine kinase ChiS